MLSLIIVVFSLTFLSFICSLLEATILSVTRPYIQTLIEHKKKAGYLLNRQKNQINESLSSILTLNTISNTTGAAIAGSIALELFGNRWIAVFSVALTLLILIFSEIIPKTIGANYWKVLAPWSSWVLQVFIITLKPIVIPVNLLAKLISRKNPVSSITREDILSSLQLGHISGAIESSEFILANNLFKIQKTLIKEIMTPRTVVYTLPPEQTAKSVIHDIEFLHYSRIPLFDKLSDSITGVVLRRDIILSIAHGKPDIKLKDLASSPVFIPETLSVYTLLDRLISRKRHLAFIINEYGDYVGIATMEDAIETLLGREIVDETDLVIDMQELARQLLKKRMHNMQNKPRKK